MFQISVHIQWDKYEPASRYTVGVSSSEEEAMEVAEYFRRSIESGMEFDFETGTFVPKEKIEEEADDYGFEPCTDIIVCKIPVVNMTCWE